MAKRFRAGTRLPHFLRAWREHRKLSQDDMAAALGCSKASVSRYESGITPYNQDVLEAWARIVGCAPVDLLARPPLDPEGLWAIYDRIREQDRARAAAVLRALLGEE